MKVLAWTTLAILSAGIGTWLLREGLVRQAEAETTRYTRRNR